MSYGFFGKSSLSGKVIVAKSALRRMQHSVIEISRSLIDLIKLCLQGFLSRVLVIRPVFRKLYVSPFRKCLKGFGKGIIFVIHEKGDDISPCAASKTVIYLLSRTH